MLLASPAGAQQVCMPSDEVELKLIGAGETQVFWGKSNTNLFELWVGEKDGEPTWTIIRRSPNGMSCLGGAGKEWVLDEWLPGSGT